MIRTAFIAALALACALSPAEARHRHHRAIVADPGCNVIFPCEGVISSPRGERIARQVGFGSAQKVYRERRSEAGNSFRPSRFVPGRLICAINVGLALAERGIKGTGSALALSYLHWGHSAGGPVPGAVIVSKRRGGGHVAIVSRVENGIVYAWNATGGQRGWREIPYRHKVLDYRVPG